MNPYFWFFAVWALMITPVTIHAGIRLDRGIHWRMRLLIAGIPITDRRKGESSSEEETLQAQQLLQGLISPKRQLIMALVHDGSLKRLLRVFRWNQLYVQGRLSFQDASQTALSYALIRTLLETLQRCGVLPGKITGRIEADFHSQGTQFWLQGIFSARLGKVAIAGIRLCISALRHRAELATEEKQYAASH